MQVRRLQELFHGRFTEKQCVVLLQHHLNDLVATVKFLLEGNVVSTFVRPFFLYKLYNHHNLCSYAKYASKHIHNINLNF